MKTYKITDSSSKKRIGKTIKFNKPVSTFTQNGLLKEYFTGIEFEDKIYNAEIVSQNKNYKTAFLMNQNSNHANANIRLTLEVYPNPLDWWKSLSEKEKWNLSINNIKHWSTLTEDEILEYYNKHHYNN